MNEQDLQVRKRWYTQIMDVYRHNNIYIPGFNSFTRFLLKTKAEAHFSAISEKSVADKQIIDEWFASKKVFFGYGVFRSGTTFLSDFLNRHTSGAVVQHEANVNDYWYYAKAMQSDVDSNIYVENYRLAEIYYRMEGVELETYGEINPFLRRHVKAMKQVLPAAKQFQLVRDPRNVIRSLMSRELFGRKDPMADLICPPKEDEYLEKWPSMSRFEKLCWLWAADNRFIRENTDHVAKFELLRTDFSYFDEKIVSFLNLDMNPDAWQSEMSKVFNSTPHYTFPKYADWSIEHKTQFESICAQEMAYYDY